MAKEKESLVGEGGADLATCGSSIPDDGRGKSKETLLFWRRENLGIGRELGGGELEYAGPAQSSEEEKSSISSLKLGPLVMGLGLIAIGLLRLPGFGGSE